MLRLHNISKSFGGVHAVKAVDFDVREGEIHALLGENGAGKSTLMKISSGIYQPDTGTIEFGGQPVKITSVHDAKKLGIRTVHQELELAGPLSVAENISMDALPLRFGMVDRARMRKIAADGLALLGADVDPNVRVDSLSVGDRQVVEITRAIVKNARVLILDEPTAALQPKEVDRLLEAIGRLKRSGASIIYISHRLNEVLSIADRITVMRDGAVVARLNRGEADRAELVRHIVGRELAEFKADKQEADSDREVLVACSGLSSGTELDGVSFDLRAQEVVGFFGLLGAGQNSIADCLVGLKPATVTGLNICGASGLARTPRVARRRGVAYIPSDRRSAGLALGLSIQENINLPNLEAISRFGFVSRSRARTSRPRRGFAMRARCDPATTTWQAMSNDSRCSTTPRSRRIAPASGPTARPMASRSACWQFISTGKPRRAPSSRASASATTRPACCWSTRTSA